MTCSGQRIVDDPVKSYPSSDTALEIARLRQLVDEQRLAIQARDDFIAIAAHELRNPMTPILGVAQLAYAAALQGGSTCPPRVKALLEQMQIAVEEFIKRATKLLDVSRIESGNLRLEPSETDLSAVAASVAQKYAVAAARGQSALELDTESGIVGSVRDRASKYNQFSRSAGWPIMRLSGWSGRLPCGGEIVVYGDRREQAGVGGCGSGESCEAHHNPGRTGRPIWDT